MAKTSFTAGLATAMAMVTCLVVPSMANAVTYQYVGSYNVGEGPAWYDNPAVYTGQEAAALIFGGAPGDYAISTISSNPGEINFLAYLDGWADEQYSFNPQPQDWSYDLNGDGYNAPGGGGTSYSAYVLDHSCLDRYSNPDAPCTDPTYINYVFRIIALSLQDVAASLQSTSMGLEAVLNTSGLIVNGAHSRPMSRRVGVGKNTFWIAGDWGNDDHGPRDGSTSLSEISFGRNFGPAQVNVSLGKTWAHQNLVHNGDIDADGSYLMVEGIIPVSESRGLYATIGAYGHRGDSEIRRGYLDQDTQVYSYGSPDTQTWGARVRLDWENAINEKSVRLSPYADLWYVKAKMDGYLEEGGTFPAYFNSRKDSNSELRLGFNAAMPIKTTGFDLIANFEAVHAFDNRGASSSGEVVGYFNFDLGGMEYRKNWVKAGLGVEGMLGKGKLSVMLNGSSQGRMASSWLAASYQLEF